MIPVKDLTKVLVDNAVLDKEKLKEYKNLSKSQDIPLEKLLVTENVISEDDLFKLIADFYGLNFMKLEDQLVKADVLNLVQESIAIKHQLVPFIKTENELVIATSMPPDLQILEFIERKYDITTKVVFTNPASIESLLGQYRKDIEDVLSKASLQSKDIDVTEVFYAIAENAVKERASDIHIEPTEKDTIIRYRIDGVMKRISTIPKVLHQPIIARIKILSNLKVDEYRLPQDGRYSMSGPSYKVSVRVSLTPIADGEKAVLRILPEKKRFLDLGELGFQGNIKAIVEKQMKRRQGMVLVVGPTGSGKTTTLYTLINLINTPEINISTIEDPIEYTIQGVNQSQVKPQIGLTFAIGLRAFLRQDPDVIMVGEIRDKLTAEIGLKAALTGHLVLSTLHTNDASRTLPRLVDMGIPHYLIPSTVNMIIAQRLVRKVCLDCKQKVEFGPKEQKQIEDLAGVPFDRFIAKNKIKRSQIGLYQGQGCKTCKNLGYRGRMGIYEVMECTLEIQEAMLKGAYASDIQKIAVAQGMATIVDDGILKIFNGQTTIEELIRVL